MYNFDPLCMRGNPNYFFTTTVLHMIIDTFPNSKLVKLRAVKSKNSINITYTKYQTIH